MKKVLIICYYWPPAGGGGVQRWLKFVKFLPEFGWEPIVYVPENPDYPLTDTSLENEISPITRVIKYPITEPYEYFRRLSGMQKKAKMDPGFLSQNKKLNWKQKLGVWIRGNIFIPDARCLWIKPSVKFLAQYLEENPVDCIISTGPPHSCHVIAKKLKDKTGLPWLADLRDPWTQIDYFNDLQLNILTRHLHKRLEKNTLDNADKLTVIGPTMAQMLSCITDTPIELLTNGYDEDDIKDIQVALDQRFTLTYIGTINDAQNPLCLWKALSSLKDENHELLNSLTVRIVGVAEENVKKTISNYGLESLVEYTGYVDHIQSIKYQRQTQVLLLLINNTWNNKLIVTGKIFEYITSGRPIICIGPKDGDAAAIISDTKTGTIFDYNEEHPLKNHLCEMYNLYKKDQIDTQSSNLHSVYSRKNITEKLANILNDFC